MLLLSESRGYGYCQLISDERTRSSVRITPVLTPAIRPIQLSSIFTLLIQRCLDLFGTGWTFLSGLATVRLDRSSSGGEHG